MGIVDYRVRKIESWKLELMETDGNNDTSEDDDSVQSKENDSTQHTTQEKNWMKLMGEDLILKKVVRDSKSCLRATSIYI